MVTYSNPMIRNIISKRLGTNTQDLELKDATHLRDTQIMEFMEFMGINSSTQGST